MLGEPKRVEPVKVKFSPLTPDVIVKIELQFLVVVPP